MRKKSNDVLATDIVYIREELGEIKITMNRFLEKMEKQELNIQRNSDSIKTIEGTQGKLLAVVTIISSAIASFVAWIIGSR